MYFIILPDISKWDLTNVINMSFMFSECSSLSSLLNFPYLHSSNVTNINGIFFNCQSLKSLSDDLSNFNTSNIINMEGSFYKCVNLKTLPNISKWKTKNVINLSIVFF